MYRLSRLTKEKKKIATRLQILGTLSINYDAIAFRLAVQAICLFRACGLGADDSGNLRTRSYSASVRKILMFVLCLFVTGQSNVKFFLAQIGQFSKPSKSPPAA